MKKRVYLIVKNPFKESDKARFNIEQLNEYFDLVILDCTEWLLPSAFETRRVETCELPNLRRIKNAHEFKNALTGQEAYALDFVGLFSFNAIRLFNILRKKKIKIVVVDSGPYPSPGPTKVSLSPIQKLIIIIKNKLFQRFVYARLLKLYQMFSADMTPDIALVSGTSWNTNPRFSKAYKIVSAHSFDYETFINVNRMNGFKDEKYAVYLDENICFHEDNKEMNLHAPVAGKSFLLQLELFFNEVEKNTGLPVKIAAYPSTELDTYKEVFKNREISFGNTASMIKNAEMIFAHASTAISFAILWRKPVFFILNFDLQASWYYADIESAQRIIKGKQINIDDLDEVKEKLAEGRKIDEEAYEQYQDTFIKSKSSLGTSLWSILSQTIYN